MDVLLSLSNEFAYFRERGPVRLSELGHDPWFWAIPKKGEDPQAALRRIRRAWEESGGPTASGPGSELSPLQKIKRIGELDQIQSFVRPGDKRAAFPIYARRSFYVPEISDELFVRHGFYSAEHDVPYQQRACVDLAARGQAWPFDTNGQKTTLKVLVYDIETTQYGQGSKRVPVDLIGWSDFEISYEASKDVEKEEFHFNLVDAPPRWQDCEVVQMSARNADEEIDNLLKFIRKIPNYQIISGHNILSFDNREIYERILYYLNEGDRKRILSPGERRAFDEFVTTWAAKDRTFTFGQGAETVNFFPTSLDTYHATRRFYFFLDDFTLKKVAPFLGIVVPNRVYLSPQDLKLEDARTLDYNRHDCQEQLGITMLLLAQALPLAFTAGWTFEEVLTGGNVRIWDHMAMIRAARQKKIMPATCRAQSVARTVLKNLGTRPTKELIADDARVKMQTQSPPSWLKEYARVAKYGDEMPDWLELPHAIVNPRAVQEPQNGDMAAAEEPAEDQEEEQELLSYAVPGGMTIHPQAVKSQFIPWWYVVDADVGAMYPTILRARNVGPDTVRLARTGEAPDDWVWLYKVNEEFARDERFVFRPTGPEENFAKPGEGVMVGVKIAKQAGLVPLAMKGIMGIATKLKRQLGEARKNPNVSKGEVDRLSMAYASLKATRNAGTHGQMLAVNVSCRGFNLWAGAEITTIGQKILADSLVELEKTGARVVYGDSVVGSRCVVVRDPTGQVQVLPIQRLWAMTDSVEHQWHGKAAKLGAGWEALCAAPRPGAPGEWKRIRRIICHEATKPVVRVRQTIGETICTEDHSLMVERGGEIFRAAPSEALEHPMVRVACPPNAVLTRIDMAELLEGPALILNDRTGPDGRRKQPQDLQRFGFDGQRVWFANKGWYSAQRPDPAYVKRFVEVGSEDCSALCRLLGAYVAEGSVAVTNPHRPGASIANSDIEWLEARKTEFERLVPGQAATIIASDAAPSRTIFLKDGSSKSYKDKTHKIQMTNATAAVFFWSLAGRGSERKRIPPFMFNLPRQHQLEFLQTLVEGDGSRKWGPRYRKEHDRFFRYETKSLELASGLCVLLSQLGMGYSIRHNVKKKTHVIFTREKAKPDRRALCEPWVNDGPVFDLEVEDHHTFVDAYGGILLHNTDGIYLACSKSGRNILTVSEALSDVQPASESGWILQPDAAYQAIYDLNTKWRKFLGYEEFELEAGHHDAMLFVVHKNYLIFDVKNGKLRMQTKGNNFRGSDKAPIAQKVLETIMVNSLRDLIEWDDEEKAREAMKASIKRWTQEAVKTLDPSKFERDDLTLIQVVQPVSTYKANATGSSIWIKRAEALEKITKDRLRAPKKYRFVVCKKPLPGIDKPSKTGIKPLDYMWPLEALEGEFKPEIDLAWYRDMIQKYVRGAFGFEDLELHAQKGLDAWM